MCDLSLHNDNSSICLDGTEVKRLRESQGLTQLYVSKVVGVTTDTISRWENNRYPTIRRDNALKLAEALEVSLDALRRKPEVTPGNTPARPRIPLLGSGLILAAVLVTVFLMSRPQDPPPVPTVSARRLLPGHAAPGASVPVRVDLTQQSPGGGFILREYFPKGWTLVQAAPPASSLDNVNGVARWIIKSGEQHERIVYLLQVSKAAVPGASSTFRGEVIFGGERSQAQAPSLGDSRMTVAPVHWADDNADGQIDDVEMLQASFTLEDMAGVYIDWDHLESLWDAGSYRWDDKLGVFVPETDSPNLPSPE